MIHTDIRPNMFTNNPKALDVLKMLAKSGSTLSNVAEVRYRSIHTINQQMRLARKLLEVKTTYQAVYKATKLGLI